MKVSTGQSGNYLLICNAKQTRIIRINEISKKPANNVGVHHLLNGETDYFKKMYSNEKRKEETAKPILILTCKLRGNCTKS